MYTAKAGREPIDLWRRRNHSWTRMIRPMRSGYSAFNASFISGAERLNPILRGWANYYRFCTGAHRVFSRLDFYVGDRIWRWLMYKHKGLTRKRSTLVRLPSSTRPTRKVWRDARTEQFPMDTLRVERFKRGWMLAPAFTVVPGEPSA